MYRPWDMYSYRDNTIQSGLEHSLASLWPGHVTAMGGRAFGQWPVDDSCVKSKFQDKKQKTFSWILVYVTTQRVQTLYTSIDR